MTSEDSIEMRSKAYSLCRDYLLGAWRHINREAMVLRRISGGLSNHLYYCALPATHKPVAGEPKEVLLRVYGQMHGEDALENMLAESVIFTLLSERGLGPRLYGVFPGGRIEQYIHARPLLREELSDPELSEQIATKVARVHALTVPINKEASWLWTSMNKWLVSVDELLSKSDKDEIVINKLQSIDYHTEVNYVKSLVHQLDCPIVFAHNDLQEGNILLLQKSKPPRKVALIDFEYCAYNYRSFDLANHFSERVYGYRLDVDPYYTVNRENYPTKEDQLKFIKTYLKEFEQHRAENSDAPCHDTLGKKRPMDPRLRNWFAEASSTEETMIKEIQIFNVVGHLFWYLWSVVQGHVSSIEFNYLDYAKTRMDHYNQDKMSLELDIERANRPQS